MRTRIFTLLVAFLAIAGNAVWGQDHTFPGGDGSEGNPYQISTADDLKAFRNLVNGGDADACAILKNDIELNSSEEWEPIGYVTTSGSGLTASTKFSYLGTFDGDGYTIKGLNLASTQNKNFIGLFTAIGTYEYQLLPINPTHTPGGVVENLTIEGSCNYQGNSQASVGGISVYNVGKIIDCTNNIGINTNASKYRWAGGICGWNIGTIQNCRNNGDISSGFAGGICGYNGGKIEKCCNYGEISSVKAGGDEGSSDYAGGISGLACSGEESIITNCYNNGKVSAIRGASGICNISTQFDDGTVSISNCHNYGKVEATEERAAGIIMDETYFAHETINVSNCYYYNENMEVGYLVIEMNGDTRISEDAPGVCEPKSKDEFANGEVLWLLQQNNPDVWVQTIGTDDYPKFETEGEGSTIYQIAFDYNYEGSPEAIAYYIEEGESVTVPTMTRDGYIFTNWSTDKAGETIAEISGSTPDASVTYYAQWQAEQTEEPEQPGDEDEEDQDTDKPGPIVKPIKYYNIYIDTICPGLNVEVSKDVVQEGHQVSAYLTIQAECDTTDMRFEYKRGLFGYWQDLKELEGVQPGEYIIKNIYTDIYIRALDATLPEEEPTGIEDLEGVKAYAKEGSIYVYTPNREEVTIIGMSGAIIKHAEQVGLQSYSVNRGIYIVHIGEKVFKLKN